MFYIIAFFIYLVFYAFLHRFIKKNLYKDRVIQLNSLNKIYSNLSEENSKIKKELDSVSNELESTIELYEITKNVCSSLNDEEIFDIFRDKLKKYISMQDCSFVKKKKIDYELYKDDLIFSVSVDDTLMGFLVVKGLSKFDEARFFILAHQFLLAIKRAVFYGQIQELSMTDGLTGLANHRYFMKRFEEEIARASKLTLNFAFLMVDIDYFKACNDRSGHLVGDVVLQEIGRILKKNTRQIDLVARYGGEEFAVLLPETSKDGAYFAAERIRRDVESKKFRAYDEELNITISIGLSSFPDDATKSQEIIEKADSGLYKAKSQGRNRTCIYEAKKK